MTKNTEFLQTFDFKSIAQNPISFGIQTFLTPKNIFLHTTALNSLFIPFSHLEFLE